MPAGLAVVLFLLLAACAGSPPDAPGPVPSSSAPTASPDSPGGAGLLAPDPAASPPADVLVAGPAGVSVVDEAGRVRLVLDEPVAFAVDDTLGGFVYQAGRGRAFGRPAHPPTTLRWRRADGTSGVIADTRPGTFFSLHDAVARDGTVEVFASFSAGTSPTDTIDTLTAFDLVTRGARDVRDIGGWEYTTEPVTVTPTLLGGSFNAEARMGIEFFDQGGRVVELGGNPLAKPAYDCICGRLAELSPDASQLAYLDMGDDGNGFLIIPEIVVVDARSGEELKRLRLDRPDQGWMPDSLDLGDGVLVVNRKTTGEAEAPMDAAWVIDLRPAVPLVWEAPVAGRAHLVRDPVV